MDITTVCLVCHETLKPSNDFHIRCFCPLVGVIEDPVTGSVANGLIHYVSDNIGINKDIYYIEQGHFIDKPGLIKLKPKLEKGQLKVITCARAKHVLSSEVFFN